MTGRRFELVLRTEPAGNGWAAQVEVKGAEDGCLPFATAPTEMAAIRAAMKRAGEELCLRLVAEATRPTSCPTHGIACPDGPLLKGRKKT